MLKLAGGISSHGYPVDLVILRASGPLMNEVPSTVRLIDLGTNRVLNSLPALVRYMRRERPVALLSVLHTNLVAVCAGRLAGLTTRIVVSERNTLSSQVQHYASNWRMRLTPHLIRRLYPWADAIVAVSEGVASDLARSALIPLDRIRTIYNPIVTPTMRKMAEATLTHSWFQSDASPVILAVGRLTAQKDFATLIRAFALVRRLRAARLMILGEGQERAALEAQIRDLGLREDVDLPGYISNPYPYMKRSALFVLSSRWEGLPGVLIEALYCGVPVVATDCPSGPREILADGKYGRLVPVGDANALAEAILGHLESPLSVAPPESWKQYTMDTVVSQYLEVLHGEGFN